MTTLKGVFPDTKSAKRKNFIRENMKNLRRMEHRNKKTERLDEVSKLQQKKVNNGNNSCSHFHNVSSKPNSRVQIKKRSRCGGSNVNNQTDCHQEFCKKSSASTLSKKSIPSTNDTLLNMENRKERKESLKSVRKVREKLSSVPNMLHKSLEDIDNNSKIKVKSQGIQTLDAKEIDELYAEGAVKYCSKKFVSSNESINKDETSKKVVTSPKNVVNLPSDRGDNRLIKKGAQNENDTESSKSLRSKEETSFTKQKKDYNSVTNKIGTQMNNSNNSNNNNNNNNNNSNNNSVPTNYRMGVIPKYIKNRKETQEKLQKAKIEESDPNCPKGHVPLPDSERKETLRMLKKNYQEYVKQLNMMPINVDTLRAQRQKIEIEKQLNKLEEGIKVFSRSKVYVKMNA